MMMITRRIITSVFFSLFLTSSWFHGSSNFDGLPPMFGVLALDNGLGRTPPMGWNSWNHFHCNINEELIHQQANALISTGLKQVGYNHINLDDCWQISRNNITKQIQEDKQAFPSGMKALGDYLHSKELKFGLYSDAGHYTCQHRPGSLGYEDIDAQVYASWGCDYLKYDNCYYIPPSANLEKRYTAMRNALNATGRPIFFSMCEWGVKEPATWAGPIGNSWRTTGDIGPNWNSILGILDHNNQYHQYAGPGGWNDPDMLEVGNGKLTVAEQRSHFTLWAVMKAPLLLGNDLTNMKQETLDILRNKNIIAINQDPLGVQGYRVWQSSNKEIEVWAGPLSGHQEYVVVLFNRASQQPTNITAYWKDIPGLDVNTNMELHDLWCPRTTTATGSITSLVEPHDSVAFRMKPVSVTRAKTAATTFSTTKTALRSSSGVKSTTSMS